MKIEVYTKTKQPIVVVRTKRGEYILTDKGLEPNDTNIDFGEGADWAKEF